MSLLNVWVSPDKALISVDTQGETVDGVRGQVSKMVPLVHANMLVAGRGHMNFLSIVFCSAHSVPGDFDTIVNRMPEVLSVSFRLLVAEMTKGGFQSPISLDRQEVVVAGWSPKQGRMVAMIYRQQTAESGFVGKQIMPWSVNPWEAAQGAPCVPENDAAHEKLAREQARFWREKTGKDWMGGRLLIAELTRHNMTFTSHCELG